MKVSANLLHLTESLTRLGGVETLVRQLVEGDGHSFAAALLDSKETGVERGWGLRRSRMTGANSVRTAARSRFAHARHLVFHNFAGMMMLSGTIPHDRKCLFLHTNSDDVFSLLPERLPYLDAILVSGRDLEEEIRGKFPNLQVPVTAVEYPLDDRYFEVCARSPGPRLIIGYSGRLEQEQKQVLRLVDLCEALESLSAPFLLEIAGSGSAMEELRRRLPADHCHFLGVLGPACLHEAYKRWDFLICTSDYETGPLVAMEAMATGAIPILPDIPCQATQLIADLAIGFHAPGDMAGAASRILQLLMNNRLAELRQAVREKVAGRRVDRFVASVTALLEDTANRPALGKTPPVPGGFAEYLPFSLRRTGNTYLR